MAITDKQAEIFLRLDDDMRRAIARPGRNVGRAGWPSFEDTVHAEMPIQDHRQTGRPIEIGSDAVPVFAQEDLFGSHAAQMDGDVVEIELLPVVLELASFHDCAA
nr:hypothetical protein [Rhizobium leguminosarum]